ncbi:MAG: hypothetical protein JWQ64_1327 [Subtercola sp.]|jgi:uncharacterized repeat protein (TIGR03943 family)|nr:hypothetical protein [Subtercola sp.]
MIAVVATVWLGVTGQLGLYIHPRYYVFTMIMAGIAVVLIVGALAAVPRADEHEQHEHPDARLTPAPRRSFLAISGAALALVVIAASIVTLLVVPPATLTTAAVEQRSLNGSSNTLTSGGTAESATGDTSAYTVKDWATLIRQGVGADVLTGTTATLTGFVTPDTDDPDNVFYVARFVITCCAVDAQPVGVPVYDPGWSKTYPTDSWVTAVGSFEANPSVLSTATTVLQPDSITAISQPSEPYVY